MSRPQVVVVLLRSINVGGRNRVPMPGLRTLAADIGIERPATYLQSGNLVGVASARPDALGRALAEGLSGRLGVDVPVLVRTAAAWATTIAGNPLVDADEDPRRLHVVLLDRIPDREAVRTLDARAGAGDFGRDRVVVDGDRVYLHTPDGYADTKLAPALLERVLGVVTTTRNWRTTLALGELAAATAAEAGTAVPPGLVPLPGR